MARQKTKLVGILNVTPDSFYEKSQGLQEEAALELALGLQEEGADWIDVGGESTRPGALPVSEEEEIKRLYPILKELKSHIKIPFSIDTMKPKVAEMAIEMGASMINDVTGLENPKMREIASKAGLLVCVMHMQANPKIMQMNPTYEKGVTKALIHWFEERIELLLSSGVKQEQIILDPGIGFGKTVADNLEIIQNLPELKKLGFPLYIGLSRKSFMGKILNKMTEDLLVATLTMDAAAILFGADYIRVHDVKPHREQIDLLDAFKSVSPLALL